MSSAQKTLAAHTAHSAPMGILRLKPYVQPFEKHLAEAELAGLGFNVVRRRDHDSQFEVTLPRASQRQLLARVDRLAYFETVSSGVFRPILQVERERAAVTLRELAKAPPKRRVLRYGPHDLHEYRGKFFPQLVRSLCNATGLAVGSVVLDPMCGSGTTLVEARALDMRALGLDRNPLSVLVSQVKTDSVGWDLETVNEVNAMLSDLPPSQSTSDPESLWSLGDLNYLERWFDRRALSELAGLCQSIASIPESRCRDFARVCLSDILRGVSYQHPDDLRVRKVATAYFPGSATVRFHEKVQDTLSQVGRLLAVDPGHKAEYRVALGDAERLGSFYSRFRGRVDLVVTSPPYATALPYLDTDRLSLIVLGLLPRAKHREVEQEMIGTREVTERQRRELWTKYQSSRDALPAAVTGLVDRLEAIYSTETTGFRRRNLPALLATYFLRMRNVLHELHEILRPRASAFVVVGTNSTSANGVRIEIPTDLLLTEVATREGFEPESPLNMELLASRDIFSKNRGSREQLLRLVKG